MKLSTQAKSEPGKKPGRPRSFDRDEALEKAMLTFWAHGYETTSISDLTKAMGINAPAIYGAFGDKEKLYLEAVARYHGDPAAQDEAIRAAPTSKDAAEMILGWAIDIFTGVDTPKGCLVGTSMATGSAKTDHIRKMGTEIREGLHTSLASRISKDINDGLLDTDTDCNVLASAIVCTVQGFSTLARDGASPSHLRAVGKTILNIWPDHLNKVE